MAPSDQLAVLFNALTPPSGGDGTGIGTYATHLMAELAGHESIAVLALSGPEVSLPAGVERVTMRRLSHRPRAAVVEDALRSPGALRRARPAGGVVHNLSFHAPPGLDTPWVQTLHDVIPLALPSPDLAALRRRWARFGPRYRRASAVIAVSHHAAADGVRLLGLDPTLVRVAPHGIDATFHPGPDGPADPPYLLVVGEYSRRKGFAEAFGVIDALADAGYPHRLVVAGRVHPWARAELAALQTATRHPERIEVRGMVPDLIPLYQGATAFLMTSRYEGFGLPALEAMACGVPVVAFANSAVTEVVADGGQLVADGDVAAMTAAVRQVLDSPAWAAELRARGPAQASQFTWARSAAIHLETYEMVTR